MDGVGDVGRYTALAFNSSGNPVISYFDATNEGLRLAVWNHPSCTNPTLTTVASAGNVGWVTSLVLNSSGNPVISYHDLASADLKLAI